MPQTELTNSPWQVLGQTWWVGLVALGVSLIATPIARLIAYRTKIVDHPDDLLKPHARPTAYLGGTAICLGLLAGLAAYLAAMPEASQRWESLGQSLAAADVAAVLGNPVWNLLAVALAGVAAMLAGLLDDVLEISPKQKILWQVLTAAVLLVGGVGVRMAAAFIPMDAPPLWLVLPISAVLCLVIVIATSNAVNLLDGMDGLCGGVMTITALGFAVLAAWLAAREGAPEVAGLRVALSLAVAGAALGFLPYNFPPASIFMGDAGSMLLGLFVAAMMALLCQERDARWFFAAWAIFAVPTLDTALAVVRRKLSGKPIFAGDRSHAYDQLADRGIPVRRIVLLFYVFAALAAVIGVTVSVCLSLAYEVAVLLALLVAIFWILNRLGMVRCEPGASPQPQDDLPTEGQ